MVLFVRARLLLIWAGRRLRRQSLESLLDVPTTRASAESAPDALYRLQKYLDFWLARQPVQDRCLRRTLILYRDARESGIAVAFFLGVPGTLPPTSEKLGAHAWLSLNGTPFLEPQPARLESLKIIFQRLPIIDDHPPPA